MKIRPTARVVLLDERNRVLLIKIEDATVVNRDGPSAGPCWITPGGGLHEGETYEAAARRELWEETGIEVAIGPCLWTAEARMLVAGEPWLVPTRFFLIRVPGPTPAVVLDHLTDDAEPAVYRDHRWWTLAAMRAASERFAPPGLPDLLVPVVAGDARAAPIAISA